MDDTPDAGAAYEERVQRAISFAGQDHEFFVEAKARELLDLVGSHVGEPRLLRALDVGCGVGLGDRFLAQAFSELHGTDVDPVSIEAARRRNPSVEYTLAGAERLPYPDGSFDVVFAAGVMHVIDPPSWPAFIAEAARVTRAGGLVAAFEHNPLNPLTRLAARRWYGGRLPALLGRRVLERLFRSNRLSVAETRYIVFFPWRSRALRAVEKRLHRLPLGAQFVVAGRKA